MKLPSPRCSIFLWIRLSLKAKKSKSTGWIIRRWSDITKWNGDGLNKKIKLFWRKRCFTKNCRGKFCRHVLNVNRELGSGFLESVYERALLLALTQKGLNAVSQ